MRDTQRVSQSCMKKRRGRREIEMARRRKRGTQVEIDRSTQYSLPYLFSIAQNTHRDSQNWTEKKRGREEIVIICGEKGESKGEESNHHTPE